MEVVFLIIFFIFGSVLGSFYNVVGYRLPKGESILKPKHSYCPTCNNKLSYLEMIPILSYVIQGGKCKHCKEKIALFYPFIELITGLLFSVSYYSFGFSYELVISLVLSSMFVIIIVSDVKYLIIPDEVTLIGAIVIIITELLGFGLKTTWHSILSGLTMFVVMYLIMLMGNYIFKKESLGGADVKLMFVVGLALHPLVGFFVIFVASLIALPISLLLLHVNEERVIPFGPFIMLATLMFYFLKIDVSAIINYLTFI